MFTTSRFCGDSTPDLNQQPGLGRLSSLVCVCFRVCVLSFGLDISETVVFSMKGNALKQLITPPRNCGGVIFSLQCVCVCVCVCVSVSVCLLVNEIPSKLMHRFGCHFR